MNRSRLPGRAVWVPVLAVVGGILLGTAVINVVGRPRSSESSPSGVGSADSRPSAQVSASQAASAAESSHPTPGLAAGWTISSFPGADPHDQLGRIVFVGDKWFVIGSHAGQGGIWFSDDTVEWHLAAELPTTQFELGAQIHGIAATDAGFVAVGANYVVDGASPLIWHSLDADHWTVVSPDPNACIPLSAVTAIGQRYVAVGAVCRYDEVLGPQADGISYASTDGIHWQRSPASEVLVDIGLEDVTSAGPHFIATGVFFGTWTRTLHSVDGLTWVEPSGSLLPDGALARRLTWADNRLVAPGAIKDSAGHYRAAIWVSTDGVTWTQHVVGGEATRAYALGYDRGEWVLVGSLGDSETATGAAVEWRSSDGHAWEAPRRILEGSGYLLDLVATSTGLFGIGGIAPEESGDPWVPTIFRYER